MSYLLLQKKIIDLVNVSCFTNCVCFFAVGCTSDSPYFEQKMEQILKEIEFYRAEKMTQKDNIKSPKRAAEKILAIFSK